MVGARGFLREFVLKLVESLIFRREVDKFGTNMEEQGYLGSKVFYRKWAKTSNPKATLIVIHGLGEYSGRYKQLAEYFCAQDLVVLCPDHLGHGLSPGRRGHVKRFEDYFFAVEEIRDELERDYPNIPCFVLGHSMGGLIAASCLVENQDRFAGAIFSGGAFSLVENPSNLLRWAVDALAFILPTLGVMKIDGRKVSRDPDIVDAYLKDSLVHHKTYSARLISEFVKAIENLQRNASVISIPALVLHGEADTLTAPEGSPEFIKNISSQDKTLKILPGVYHEILNEPEGPQLMSDMKEWIYKRL